MLSPLPCIVTDTNLWISSLISEHTRSRIESLIQRGCVFLYSDELLSEIKDVSEEKKFRKKFSIEESNALIERLKTIGAYVDVHSVVTACRDPKYNYLLALAQDGNADYLISGDSDLLSMKQFGETKIVTITEFLTEFN